MDSLFAVLLDLPADHQHAIIGVVYRAGDEDREARVIYETLSAGQFAIEGGYPCAENCGSRHRPRVVARADSERGPFDVIWRG